MFNNLTQTELRKIAINLKVQGYSTIIKKNLSASELIKLIQTHVNKLQMYSQLYLEGLTQNDIKVIFKNLNIKFSTATTNEEAIQQILAYQHINKQYYPPLGRNYEQELIIRLPIKDLQSQNIDDIIQLVLRQYNENNVKAKCLEDIANKNPGIVDAANQNIIHQWVNQKTPIRIVEVEEEEKGYSVVPITSGSHPSSPVIRVSVEDDESPVIRGKRQQRRRVIEDTPSPDEVPREVDVRGRKPRRNVVTPSPEEEEAKASRFSSPPRISSPGFVDEEGIQFSSASSVREEEEAEEIPVIEEEDIVDVIRDLHQPNARDIRINQIEENIKRCLGAI